MLNFALSAVLIAATPPPAPIFTFETDELWLNLHHYLYVLGRAEAKAADASREAVAGAPADEAKGLELLNNTEKKTWREAVASYAAGPSQKDLLFDGPLLAAARVLASADDSLTLAGTGVDAALAVALEHAAPLYRKAWWPVHRTTNRARKMLSSKAADQRGTLGLETAFHEAMHQWDPAISRLVRDQAKRLGKRLPPNLTHGMIFFTAGEAVRHVVPEHQPVADVAGVWGRGFARFREPLVETWKPWLDGKGTRDEALAALVARTGTDQKQ